MNDFNRHTISHFEFIPHSNEQVKFIKFCFDSIPFLLAIEKATSKEDSSWHLDHIIHDIAYSKTLDCPFCRKEIVGQNPLPCRWFYDFQRFEQLLERFITDPSTRLQMVLEMPELLKKEGIL